MKNGKVLKTSVEKCLPSALFTLGPGLGPRVQTMEKATQATLNFMMMMLIIIIIIIIHISTQEASINRERFS